MRTASKQWVADNGHAVRLIVCDDKPVRAQVRDEIHDLAVILYFCNYLDVGLAGDHLPAHTSRMRSGLWLATMICLFSPPVRTSEDGGLSAALASNLEAQFLTESGTALE